MIKKMFVFALGLVACSFVNANIRISSFRDIGDFSLSQSISMVKGDNLKILNSAGMAEVVSAEGYWHLGLLDSEGYIIGWAKNSQKTIAGRQGRLIGGYSYLLGEGSIPLSMILIHDKDGNGIVINENTGSIMLENGDEFYLAKDVLFNDIRGDMSQFMGYLDGDGVGAIPSMTIIPEPATITLIGLGGMFLRRRVLQ